jgi:hypothetical protein
LFRRYDLVASWPWQMKSQCFSFSQDIGFFIQGLAKAVDKSQGLKRITLREPPNAKFLQVVTVEFDQWDCYWQRLAKEILHREILCVPQSPGTIQSSFDGRLSLLRCLFVARVL